MEVVCFAISLGIAVFHKTSLGWGSSLGFPISGQRYGMACGAARRPARLVAEGWAVAGR